MLNKATFEHSSMYIEHIVKFFKQKKLTKADPHLAHRFVLARDSSSLCADNSSSLNGKAQSFVLTREGLALCACLRRRKASCLLNDNSSGLREKAHRFVFFSRTLTLCAWPETTPRASGLSKKAHRRQTSTYDKTTLVNSKPSLVLDINFPN